MHNTYIDPINKINWYLTNEQRQFKGAKAISQKLIQNVLQMILKVKSKIIELLNENIGQNLGDFEFGGYFYIYHQKCNL